jgi:hypothetical protein
MSHGFLRWRLFVPGAPSGAEFASKFQHVLGVEAGKRAHGGGLADHKDNEERKGSVTGKSGHRHSAKAGALQ